MELTVFDRLILLNVLSAIEGDITTLRILRELKEGLSFGEKEHEALQFHQEGGQMRWKAEAAEVKNVTMGDVARGLVAGRLKELNTQKKLREEHIPLYEKFVEEKA